MLNKDYKEMLQILLKNKVKFLVVGAYAMGAHGYPRATGDLDIWIDASSTNSKRMYRSLSEFGAPLSELSPDTFTAKGITFQIGVAPRRIDIITMINGVDFRHAYSGRQDIPINDIMVPFISKKDLIKNKESTGREKDRLDAECLRKVDRN
jgi:hypothetical protein